MKMMLYRLPIRQLVLSVGIAACTLFTVAARNLTIGEVNALTGPLAVKPEPVVSQDGLDDSAESGVYTVDAAYYRQFTYNWTDEQGQTHTSTLLDRATSRNQIVALLTEIYTNPLVPGYTHDHSASLGHKYSSDRVTEVKYSPRAAAPFNMELSEVQTPIEGMTAILVEMNEDYMRPDQNFAPNYNVGAGPEECLRAIKAVSVVPKQFYVVESETATNPGFLVNIEGTLNRCFVMMKGNLRVTGHPANPFLEMFEECSPSNSNPVFNMNADLAAGRQFAVDHVCGSVILQYHDMVMAPNKRDYKEYPTNMIFYVPDYRFAGETRHNTSNLDDQTTYEHYTFYSNDYQPYFLSNRIKASIEKPQLIEVADQEGNLRKMAEVPIAWNSIYKDITKVYGAPEEFYVYEVKGDIISRDPIPFDRIRWENADGEVRQLLDDPDEKGAKFIDSSSPNISGVYILEEVTDDLRDVSYIVFGRRADSDFSFTESNVVTATIPGNVSSLLHIVIDGEDVSIHDVIQQKNDYVNTISLLENDELTAAHVMEGSIFELRRYTSDEVQSETGGSFVARVKIRQIHDKIADGWAVRVYRISRLDENNQLLKDADGNVVTPEEVYESLDGTMRPGVKSFKVDLWDHQTNRLLDDSAIEGLPLLALDKEGATGHLLQFADIFDAETTYGNHPSEYIYRLFLTTNPRARVADAQSNIVDVPVIKRELFVGYLPYTADEIFHDAFQEPDSENRLSSNPMVVAHEVMRNNNIAGYEVYEITADNTVREIAYSTRGNGGQFVRYYHNPVNGKFVYDDQLNPMTMPNFTGVLIYRFPEEFQLNPYSQYAIRAVYKNGSSYGNDRKMVAQLPSVSVKALSIKQGPIRPDWSRDYNCEIAWTNNTVGDIYTPVAQAIFAKIDCDHGDYRWYRHDDTMAVMTPGGNEGGHDEPLDPSAITASYALSHSDPAYVGHTVSATHTVRTYFEVPSNVMVAQDGSQGYVFADGEDTNRTITVSGIESVDLDAAPEGETLYFDLHGVRVDPTNLPAGIYIRLTGTHAEKVALP